MTAFKDDLELIKEIAKVLKETELTEIEIQRDNTRIKVVNNSPAPVYSFLPGQTLPAPQVEPNLDSKEAPTSIDKGKTVTSPMVGTVYLKPTPESANFVTIGSKVNVGDKLLLIEAMKTFNEVTAQHSGKIAKILIEDGQPVEFAQPLMIIEP